MAKKRFTYTLVESIDLGRFHFEGGTVLGVFETEHEGVEPDQLMHMAKYRQVAVDVSEVDSDLMILRDDASQEDYLVTDEPGDDDSDSDSEGDETTNLDGQTSDQQSSDQPDADQLAGSDLEESVVLALADNGITTRAQLLAFIETGKDLISLKKIGTDRVKKIKAFLGM